MDLQQVQALLKKYNIAPTKKRGQNFLLEESYLEKMVQAAGITEKDTVLEIGPGLGVLTEKLSQASGKVIAVELDKHIIDFLQKELLPQYPNVQLIEGDALSGKIFHAIVRILAEDQIPNAHIDPKDENYYEILDSIDKSYLLVANLPYQITSKIMRQFLEAKPRPKKLVVMVQKEVAERMIAKPGQMSLLALSVQTASMPEIITTVPASAYYPKPEVDSAIIFCNLEQPNEQFEALEPQQKKQFWKLARLGFSSKRKKLKNNLRSISFQESIDEVFAQIGLIENSRAQELTIEQWVKLTELLA